MIALRVVVAAVVAAAFLGAWVGVDVIDPGYGCVNMDEGVVSDGNFTTPAAKAALHAWDLRMQEINERDHAGCAPDRSHFDQLDHDIAASYPVVR